MKNTLFLILSSVMLLIACNNSPKNNPLESNVEVIEEETMEEIPTFSEIDFEDAAAAYRAGKYKEAAQHLEVAIKDLTAESADLPKAAKNQVNKSLATLKKMEATIKNGKIVNMDEMEKAFIQAETALAHDYLFVTSIYAIGQPTKAKEALDKAVKRMERATQRLQGKSQGGAKKLLAKGKALQNNNTESAAQWSAEVKNMVEEMNEWRREHKVELFSKRNPEYYPYMY